MKKSLFLLVTVQLGLLSGCSTDLCPKLYDKRKECAEGEQADKMPTKEEFVEKCTADQKKEKEEGTYSEEDEKAIAECLGKDDCEEVGKCMGEVSRKSYNRKQIKKIEAAKESGELEQMKDACQYVSEEDAELFEACKDVIPKMVEAVTKQVNEARDKGEHDFGLCVELEGYAKNIGADAEAAAKKVCQESQAGESVKKAIDAAKEAIEAKEDSIPYECEAAIKDLDEVATDWAKGKKTEVLEACYEELGKTIMAAKVPDMKYCDFGVKKVYEAVEKYDLKDAELLEWVEKAKAACDK